jgi:uncharacterized protein YukE
VTAPLLEEVRAVLYRKGADPEALDRVAVELARSARDVDGVRIDASRAVSMLGQAWGGDDADRLTEDWQRAAAQLSLLGTRLDDLATRLRDNARGQRAASGPAGPSTAGGAIGAGGRTPWPPWPFGGLGPTPGPPPTGPGGPEPRPLAEETRGTEPRPVDLELARLARGVYDGTGTERFVAVADDDLRALGIDPSRLTGPGGFQAQVYADSDGGYVLAFAGTDPTSVGDWATNIQQGTGQLSTQHLQAIGLARDLDSAVGPDHLVLTGHSLGGGLASTAAAATGQPAVTFNAAGVHPNTLLAAAALGGGHVGIAADQVRNYHVRGELLTTLQNPLGSFVDHVPFGIGDNVLAPDALGTQIALDPAERPRVSVSGWAAVSPVVGVVDVAVDLGSWSVHEHQAPSVIEAMEASTWFGKQ